LAAGTLEVDYEKLCDLERDFSSGILLDQSQCQVNGAVVSELPVIRELTALAVFSSP